MKRYEPCPTIGSPGSGAPELIAGVVERQGYVYDTPNHRAWNVRLATQARVHWPPAALLFKFLDVYFLPSPVRIGGGDRESESGTDGGDMRFLSSSCNNCRERENLYCTDQRERSNIRRVQSDSCSLQSFSDNNSDRLYFSGAAEWPERRARRL